MITVQLYSELTRESVASLMNYVDWYAGSDSVQFDICCSGGEVLASWGLVAKINAAKAKGSLIVANIHGDCESMATVLLPFFDVVTALELNSKNIMIHRASYSDDYEPNENEQAEVEAINRDIYNALASKIDLTRFKEVAGYELSDLFDKSNKRVECYLTAKEAKYIGLVDKIIPLTTETRKTNALAIAACADNKKPTVTAAKADNINNKKVMDIQKLKTEHPDLYKEVFESGKVEGKAEAEAAKQSATVTAQGLTEAQVTALVEKGIAAAMLKAAPVTQTAKAQAAIAQAENKPAVEAKKPEEMTHAERFMAQLEKMKVQ